MPRKKDPREGEGTIRAVKTEPKIHGPATDADRKEAAERIEVFNDPMPYLEQLEKVFAETLCDHQVSDGADFEVQGLKENYRFRLPAAEWHDQPAIINDAIEGIWAITAIGCEISNPPRGTPRLGWLLVNAMRIGEELAAISVRPLERATSIGIAAINRPGDVLLTDRPSKTEQCRRAKELAVELLKDQPSASDGEVREHVSKGLKIKTKSTYDYLSKGDIKEIRK